MTSSTDGGCWTRSGKSSRGADPGAPAAAAGSASTAISASSLEIIGVHHYTGRPSRRSAPVYEHRACDTNPAAPGEFGKRLNNFTLKVLDAQGKRVDKADARVDRADRGLLRVSLEALGPGVYTVVWRVVSVDTHVTEGDFAFHVEP